MMTSGMCTVCVTVHLRNDDFQHCLTISEVSQVVCIVCGCGAESVTSALRGNIINRWVKADCSIGNVCSVKLLLKEKHAAVISLHNLGKKKRVRSQRKKESIVCSDTPVCVRCWGIFGTGAGTTSHSDITGKKKNPPMWAREGNIFLGWRMSKSGNTASVFSAASVRNSLAYLWCCCKTVTRSGERHLALVMGFNRKCGVTSETGRDGGLEGGGGAEHKRSCGGRWMQINPFSALTEEPKTPPQQNKNRSPGGRAQRDKSLRNV